MFVKHIARLLFAACTAISCSAIAAPGYPDNSFGSGGKVVLKRGGTLFENEGFALQPDGKFLVPYVGRGLNGAEVGGVVRYNADRTVDTTFGYMGQAFATGPAVALSGGLVFAAERVPYGASDATYDYVGVVRLSSAGVRDGTYGVNGRTPEFKASLSANDGDGQHVRSIAVAPDGKVVIAGIAKNASNLFEVLVARFNLDGTLDTSFATTGWTRFAPFGSANNHDAEALVILSDGSVIVSGTKGLDHGDTGFVAKLTPSGLLDSTWASAGYYTITDRRHCLGLAVDGSGLVVACHESAATSRFHIFRLAGSGALDAGFDSTLKEPPGSPTVAGGVPAHVLKLPDGRFLISGSRIFDTGFGTVEKFTLLALTATGAIDTSFASSGWYYDSDAAFGTSYRYARTAAWNGTSIDVVGKRLIDNRFEVALANFSSSGALNALTFDNPVSATNYFRVKALPDGKLLAGGTVMTFISPNDEGQPAAQISRYMSNGVLDSTFGTGGHADLAFEKLGNAGLRDFALLPDGKLVITGDFNKPGEPEFGYVGIGQALSAGGIDTAFNAAGTPGYNRTLIGAPFTRNLKVQSDGKIVVTGLSNTPTPPQFGVVRFNADGTLDTAYGTGGLARSAFANTGNPRHLALDASGRAVVTGNFIGTIGLARFTTAGLLDSTFGTSGQTNHALPPGMSLNLPNKIVVLTDDRLLIGFSGWTATGGAIGFLRLNADGSIDNGFGVNGFATAAIGLTSPNTPNLWDMVVTANGRITATVTGIPAEGQPRRTTLIRFNPNGTLDTSFGDGGTYLYQGGAGESLELVGIDVFADGALALAGGTGAESISNSLVVRTMADPSAVLPLTFTSLISSLNPSTVGQNVTFTATITGGPGSPTGTVNFRNGAGTIVGCGAVSVAANQAACNTSGLPAGTLSITAEYSGDASRLGSTSAVLSQVVNAGSTAGRRFDFHGDLKADILWRQQATTGENYLYPMDGRTILASEGYIRSVPSVWQVGGVIDFDGDGKADILWRNTSTGENYMYPMDGRTIKATEGYIRSVPTNWIVAGTGDFDGDGKGDILWRNTSTGENYVYFMDGRTIKATEGYIRSVPTDWIVAGVGDFDGDGKADILWRKSGTGENYLYPMDGRTIKATEGFIRPVSAAWVVGGVGDFDGDGKTDILWRNTSTGENYMYPMDGRTIKATEGYIRSVPTVWIPASIGDFDGDTKADILWRNTSTGENYIYPMDGRTIKATEGFIRSVPTSWSVVTK